MALCLYCGRKIYWFSNVHGRCAENAQKGYSRLVAEVAAAVNADKSFADARPALDRIVAEHNVLSHQIHNAVKEGWANAAEQIGLIEPLNTHRHSTMMHFYQEAGIPAKEIAATDGFKTAAFSMMLWFVMTGKPIPSEHPHPFNLDKGEIPLAFFGSVVYSHKIGIRAYGQINPGTSIQFAHGRYYPYSSFMAERADTRMLKEIDYGGMLVTTNNIYFGGEYKRFRIPYEQLVSLRPYWDSLEIFRDTTSAQCELFSVVNAWPACGWVLFNLVHFLTQPAARSLYSKKSNFGSLPSLPENLSQTTSSVSPTNWDVFISHASEDKNELVRPLAEALKSANLSVWYDEFSLKLGDSLRKSIDLGLLNSRYGIVVLSKNFFAKHWPVQELNGLVTREVNGNNVILPIWHKVTFEEVRAFSPILADRVAGTSEHGLEQLVKRILEVVNKS